MMELPKLWVYVRFVEDDVFQTVESTDIKKFDKDDIKFNQKYSVKWKDGDYYKAQIIYVKDSLKELNVEIEKRRVRMVRKQLLKSDESSSDEAVPAKIKILTKKSIDLKKTAIENAKKENEIRILSKFTSKPEEKKEEITEYQLTINNLKKEIALLRKENDILKRKNDELTEEKKNIEILNISLQNDVIEVIKDFKNKLAPDLMIPKPKEVKVGQIVGDEVHIGQGFFLKKSTYNSCLVSARSGAQFVKNIAVAIFGIDVLKISSVTGRHSNRIKKTDVRPPLDANKLQAIRDIYKHYLIQKGQDDVSLDFDLSKIGGYISSKISDLNRLTRSKDSAPKNILPEQNIFPEEMPDQEDMEMDLETDSNLIEYSKDNSSDEKNSDCGDLSTNEVTEKSVSEKIVEDESSS